MHKTLYVTVLNFLVIINLVLADDDLKSWVEVILFNFVAVDAISLMDYGLFVFRKLKHQKKEKKNFIRLFQGQKKPYKRHFR